MKIFIFLITCLYGITADVVNEDADIKELAENKFKLLEHEIKELNRRAEIPRKYLADDKKSKRKNIPLFPNVDEVNVGHPIVHAFVSDRPEKPGLKKTIIPAGKDVVYDIHDGPTDSYEEVNHDISRRFQLMPKWFKSRVPPLLGKHFAKRYYNPFGSIQTRAQIAHHGHLKTQTGSRRQLPHSYQLPGTWMHAPRNWPEAPHDFQHERHIDINETPKEFMEMQSGHIAPMNAHATQPINLQNAVGDLVDIPDGEGAGLDDDLKEIPHSLMHHLNPDIYEPPPPTHSNHYNNHWLDYASLPHHHHHHHIMNPCHHSPCLNNGVCHFLHKGGANNPYSFKCDCASGFNGHYCEHMPFSCHPNPCKHGGLCTHQQNNYFCTCPQDYKGHNCEIMSSCAHSPCFNGGQCVETTDGFYCQCNGGFTGKNCNEKISLCANNPCQNGGTCHEIVDEQRFECTCPKTFGCVDCTCPVSPNSIPLSSPALSDASTAPQAALVTAQLTVTATPTCPENQCKNGGSCVKSQNTFSCNCPTGFHGLDCSTPDLCNPNPCENNGVCVQDGDENYKCVCPYGFKGSDCQTPLACSAHPCMNSATCVETPEGYHCRCSTGYKGKKCTELSPCSRNPCMHKSICVEKGPLYTCTCRHGYRGKNCREKDPCVPNPCQNGLCGEVAGVTNCNCTHGWMGDSCEIENLCQQNHCMNGATCVHTLEEFKCICPEGYHGTACEFRSPCHINPCRNGGICEEAGNTYVCRCGAGFHGDRCHLSSHCHPNPCHNGGQCYDGDDEYVCECPPGFFGKHCNERHQCFSNPCQNGAQCVEMDDTFHCKCRLGYYGRLCEDNICDPHPCRNGGTCMAANNDIGYACECRFPYHGHKCDETDPCVPSPCKNAGTCHSHLQRIKDVNFHVGPTFHGQDDNVVSVVGPIHNTTVHSAPFYDVHSHSMNYLPDANMQTNEVNHFHLTSDEPKKVYEDQVYNSRINNNEGEDDRDNEETGIKYLKKNDENEDEERNEKTHSKVVGSDTELPKKHTIYASNMGYHVEEYPEDEHSNIRAQTQEDYDAEKRSFKAHHHHRHHHKLAESSKRSLLRHRSNQSSDNIPQVMVVQRNSTTSEIVKRTIHDLYVCQCLDGYLGAHCQHRNPCGREPCRNGGTCIPRGDMYQCRCPSGYGGLNCNDPHPCDPNPCNNDGQCLLAKTVRGYVCDCGAGWRGFNCEVRDNCAINNPCQHGGRCLNTIDGVDCKCRARFAGEMCQVDKCADCDENAICRHGHCVCKPGFVGTGFRCRSLGDICSPNPCDNEGKCRPGFDSGRLYTCTCPVGYVGGRCEFSNPCVTMPCQNNGACVDESNSKHKGIVMMDRLDYKCFCLQGYRGKKCEEAVLGSCSSGPCLHNGTCFDASSLSHRKHLTSLDDYECFCKDGYAGRDCEIDHSACYSNPCMNGATCLDSENLPGVNFDAHGYKCNCRHGHTGRNCEVILNGPGACHREPCLHEGRCVDITNNNDVDIHFDYEHEFYCFCNSQYSGKVCEIPYPACYSMPCLHNGTCIDQSRNPSEMFDESGYHCQCVSGYEGKQCEHLYAFTSEEIEESIFKPTDSPGKDTAQDVDVKNQDSDLTPTPLVVFMKSTKHKRIHTTPKPKHTSPKQEENHETKVSELIHPEEPIEIKVKDSPSLKTIRKDRHRSNTPVNPNPRPTTPVVLRQPSSADSELKNFAFARHSVENTISQSSSRMNNIQNKATGPTQLNTLSSQNNFLNFVQSKPSVSSNNIPQSTQMYPSEQSRQFVGSMKTIQATPYDGTISNTLNAPNSPTQSIWGRVYDTMSQLYHPYGEKGVRNGEKKSAVKHGVL